MTLTATPALMPPRRRGHPQPLDQGGPMRPGHHLCLRDVTAGHVCLVDDRWCWAWPDVGDVPIGRPRSGYLSELLRAGLIHTDGGAVHVAAAAA